MDVFCDFLITHVFIANGGLFGYDVFPSTVISVYHNFGRIQDWIAKFVTKNSGIKEEKFLELMFNTGELAADVGSVIDGEEAVKLGLIDQLGGLSNALAYLHGEIEARRTEESNIILPSPHTTPSVLPHNPPR